MLSFTMADDDYDHIENSFDIAPCLLNAHRRFMLKAALEGCSEDTKAAAIKEELAQLPSSGSIELPKRPYWKVNSR